MPAVIGASPAAEPMKRLNAAMIWDSHHVPLEIRLFPRSNCLQSAPNPAFPRARGKEQAASARRKDRPLLRVRGKEQAASAQRKDRSLLRMRGREQAASAQRKDCSLLRLRGKVGVGVCCDGDWPPTNVASALRRSRLCGTSAAGACCKAKETLVRVVGKSRDSNGACSRVPADGAE